MLHLRRILFPTDFSACAEGAYRHAAYLARRTGAELHVLHVIEGVAEPLVDWVEDFRITPEDVAADLDLPAPEPPDAARGRDRKPGGFVPIVDAEERAEKAGPAILQYVEDNDVDLVVMGTHGRRGVRRLLMGSVAEEVVRLAPCPVFTVGGRDTCEGGWSIGRIVTPTDFSEHAALAARHAAALAEAYGAALDLLHVIDPGLLLRATDPFMGASGNSTEEVRLRGQEALERLAAELEGEFPAVGGVGAFVRIGRPPSDIVSFAEGHAADLLVVGSHGRTGVGRLLIGSVAERVVRSAPCPVYTVKSFVRPLMGSTPERERLQPDQPPQPQPSQPWPKPPIWKVSAGPPARPVPSHPGR
jgi:nucleotide-binding universal stress UspA family protein